MLGEPPRHASNGEQARPLNNGATPNLLWATVAIPF